MIDETCLVCGRRGLEPRWEILLRCPDCGFVTARLDGPIETRALYAGDYFKGEEYLDYLGDEPFFRRNFRSRLRHVRRFCPGGRLLEIGSAYGFFLDEARPHFAGIGFEANPEAARYARERFGLDVRTEDFLAVDEDAMGGPVDAAVMWDVIEHLERPDRFITRLAAVLKPGAILCLTTGDIGSMIARLRGRKWRMIHPPSHLHYFSRPSITRLLDRYGYDVVDIRPVGVGRSFRQILYSILVLGLGMRRTYERIESTIPAGWGVTLNTFDIMQVTARRRGQS